MCLLCATIDGSPPRLKRPTVNQWCSPSREKGQAGQTGLPTGTGTPTRQHERMPSSGSGLLGSKVEEGKRHHPNQESDPYQPPPISYACSGLYFFSISGLGLAWDCKVRRCFPQVAVLHRTPSFFIHNWCNGCFCLSHPSHKTSGLEEQYCSILSWNHPRFLQVKHVQVFG